MNGGWGSFRTTDGDASVGDDTLHIERSPRKFLRGQRTRWRDGGRRGQVIAVGKLLGFVLTPLFAVYQVSMALGTTPGTVAALSFGFVLLGFVQFLRERTRSTRIELSTIERVVLDETERELRFTHDTSGRLARLDSRIRRWLSSRGFDPADGTETETSLTLLTDEDLRAAQAVFRARGIPVTIDSSEHETETEHRYEIRNGVVFCALCGSQVSPNDRICPSCERPLTVERTTESDQRAAREPTLEY